MNIRHPKSPKFIGKSNHRRKRWLVVAIATVLFATIVTFGVFSYVNWHNQAQRTTQASTMLTSLVDDSLGKDSATVVTVQIKAIVDDFDKLYVNNPCVSPPQFRWETILPAIQDIQHTCDVNFSHSLDTIKSLKELLAFMDLEKTSAISIKAATESTMNSSDYAASAKIWLDLANQSSSVTDTSFQPVTDTIKSVATMIATSYTALSSALSKESETELDDAISDLQKSYKALATINNIAVPERTKLIDSFTHNYDKL